MDSDKAALQVRLEQLIVLRQMVRVPSGREVACQRNALQAEADLLSAKANRRIGRLDGRILEIAAQLCTALEG